MKAATAHRIALRTEMKPILGEIKEHARNGKFCLFKSKLNVDIIRELEKLGYSVELGTSGTCHYIEWFDIA